MNHTQTIESILPKHNSLGYYAVGRNGVKYTLGKIKHIHGYTNQNVVLGVNDSSQIRNKIFHNDIEISEMFIKHEANANQRHGIENECYNIIDEADVIYIYGSSLGETDIYIWKLLGKRLEEGKKIIIFKNGGGIDPRFGHHRSRVRREVKNKCITLSGIDEKYGENIYVGIKSEIFKF